MLSLNSNIASMRIQNALTNTQQDLMTSMTRLGTGYRINSAADDAAGLQIATRLLTQSRGMEVASQNTQNAKSMLQTAEGSLTEMSNILDRMKQLATQSADAGNGDGERAALQKEYGALGTELKHMMTSSAYGNEKLFSGAGVKPGKLQEAIKFQVGSNADDVMSFDVSAELKNLDKALAASSKAAGPTPVPDIKEVATLKKEYQNVAGLAGDDLTKAQTANDKLVTDAIAALKTNGADTKATTEQKTAFAAVEKTLAEYKLTTAATTPELRSANDVFIKKFSVSAEGDEISSADGARKVLSQLDTAIDSVVNVRGAIGAGQNRLSHISVNLSNMMTSAKDSEGRLRDVDYASETANMTKLNILQQVGGSMLKQSGQMRQMVLSLLQQ